MTDHYAVATELLRVRRTSYNGGQTVRDTPPLPEDVARAQAHATLALVEAIWSRWPEREDA